MKNFCFSICLLLVFMLTGCASMRVTSDFDDTADFSTYSSFAWMAKPDQVQDNLTRLGQIQGRIESAVEQNLISHGFQKTSDAPDFYVVYHAAVEQQITGATIDTWGYGYRRPLRRSGVVYADVSVDSFQEGTLIIDIVDASQNELVWRGTAIGAVNTPQQAAEKIDEAVQRILMDFPPASNS